MSVREFPVASPVRLISVEVDGKPVKLREGGTILDACKSQGVDTPTICFAPNLTPVNACRVCVVEVEGARTLVPACARKAEPGMKVKTDTPRVRHSRKLVLEFLSSSVDLSTANADMQHWMKEYEANPDRFGARMSADEVSHQELRDERAPGHHHAPDATASAQAETVQQPVKIDNDLYVRDYSKCVLCYKCVEACGTDAQHTFAIAVAGRGFDARISTEFANPLPEGACVYCGNCIGVCPTGALMFKSEHDMRAKGTWDETKQTATNTICPYCGVGCELTLHVQDNAIVKVTSPADHSVTNGHLCVKGRFGAAFAGKA